MVMYAGVITTERHLLKGILHGSRN
jgi:hypothetical protein